MSSPEVERSDPLSDPEISASSPIDESDAGVLSGPTPGLKGEPVRWFDADRSEPYTRITPFDSRHDTSVEFFYKPITLTALGAGLVLLAYVAITDEVIEEGRDKRRLGIYAAIASFLTFALLHVRDGPFIRPHPAFWRLVLGINLLYELLLVFLLHQDLASARKMMLYLDDNLGVPLPEKSYAEDCSLTASTLWNAVDIFALAHFLGWFGKALILRDYWFCWILSVSFELAEYSLEHQLPNFKECWWDHWVLDVLLCNWLGTYLGMRICQFFEVKSYTWQGFRQTRGFRQKTRRVFKQLSPHDFTAFRWEGTADFAHYVSVVTLLAVFLAAELNPFYLKALLWMEPDHPLVIARLAGVFLCGIPAVREFYDYMTSPKKVARMGQHAWLLLATILTEVLIILKWSRGQFPNPFPLHVKIGAIMACTLVVAYPLFKFGLPKARKYLRKRGRFEKKGAAGKVE